jgi:hypothetical protein
MRTLARSKALQNLAKECLVRHEQGHAEVFMSAQEKYAMETSRGDNGYITDMEIASATSLPEMHIDCRLR